MPTPHSFGVSQKGSEPIEVTIQKPDSLEDPAWEKLVANPVEDINELAFQNLVIKIQGGARQRLSQGADAVQNFVNAYKYGGPRVGGVAVKPRLSSDAVKTARFSKAQLEMLRAAGVVIEDEAAEE